MTRKEFLQIEDVWGTEEAIRQLASEEKCLHCFDWLREEVEDLVAGNELTEARRVLDAIEGCAEDSYWYYKKGRTPKEVSCYEDVAFLLEDGGEDYLPEADDDYYYKIVKGVK